MDSIRDKSKSLRLTLVGSMIVVVPAIVSPSPVVVSATASSSPAEIPVHRNAKCFGVELSFGGARNSLPFRIVRLARNVVEKRRALVVKLLLFLHDLAGFQLDGFFFVLRYYFV